MDRFEFYKERYYNEEEIKRSLDAALNFPIGFGSSLIVLAYYLFDNSDQFQNRILTICFELSLFISVVYILLSFFYLFMSYIKLPKGFPYGYWPNAEKTEEYYQALLKTHNNDATIADKEFEEESLKKCVEVVNFNFTQNTTRIEFVRRGKVLLFYGMLSIIVASGFWFSNLLTSNNQEEIDKIHKVEIVN